MHEQRKRERISKLKSNTEMNEEIKLAIDPEYKQATQLIETAAKLEKEAITLIKKNISV